MVKMTSWSRLFHVSVLNCPFESTDSEKDMVKS